MSILNNSRSVVKKKAVLFVCKGHPNIAGAQLYLRQVAGVFPPQDYYLHYALQVADGTKVFDEIGRDRPVKVWEYDWRHLKFADSFRQALDLLRDVSPDFVIFNSSEDEVIPPLLAAYVRRVKNKVMVVHWAQSEESLPLLTRKGGLPFPCFPSRYSIKTRVKRSLAYKLLNKMVFVNQVTRDAYLKLYRVRRKKCQTVYNGVDRDAFRIGETARSRHRAELGVGAGETMLLATGNLTAVKGHDVLIDATARLIARGMAVKCFIAGQGELQHSLQNHIDRLQISSRCKLLGFRDDVPQLLAAADIFCMPSINEALGYSLIEAMAAGKPVVATNVGGIPEVVTDASEGILVQPGSTDELANELERLVRDEQLRKVLSAGGMRKVGMTFSHREMQIRTAAFLGV